MKTRLFNLWESVRTSFWFLPGLLVLASIALSVIMIAVDRQVELESYQLFGLLFTGGPEGARSVLSTIAGSMITIAGVTFSITIVALTLASSQFGPRLLRNFMMDTGNQVVLGTFIATFIYCLLVLRSVAAEGPTAFVPSVSVTFAVVLALTNVGVLIYFIHHVSTSIQADRVIASVDNELSEHLQRLFPEELGQELGQDESDEPDWQSEAEECDEAVNLAAAESGYLQAVDSNGLLEIASSNDLLICLRYRPGEFVVAGSTLVAVKSPEPLEASLASQIVGAFILGPQRTPEQDAEFAIHQLVEIALRALSPGINDPFTAITCLDRLGSALCYLAERAFPSPYRYDGDGKLRVTARPITFAGITNTAFDQIRQYGRSSAAVTIRLLETLGTIGLRAHNAEQRQALLRQANMIERGCHESLPEANDRQDVQKRYQGLLDILESPAQTRTQMRLTKRKGGLTMNRKAFIDKVAAQLKQWDAEIAKLEARAQKAGADAEANYSKQIENLRSKKQAAQDNMEQVKQASDEAWHELRSGAEKAFDDVKTAFQSALSKFK